MIEIVKNEEGEWGIQEKVYQEEEWLYVTLYIETIDQVLDNL